MNLCFTDTEFLVGRRDLCGNNEQVEDVFSNICSTDAAGPDARLNQLGVGEPNARLSQLGVGEPEPRLSQLGVREPDARLSQLGVREVGSHPSRVLNRSLNTGGSSESVSTNAEFLDGRRAPWGMGYGYECGPSSFK